MEMQQARYFVALCETLNFTRAAEKCNVTQPSLTRAIKLLEDELGGPLFNRERNQTHLTELGRLMEPHLREVIDQAQIGAGPGQQLLRAAHRPAEARRRARASRSQRSTTRSRRFVAGPSGHRDRACTTIARASCARRCGAAISSSCSCRSARTIWTTCTTTRWARIGCSRSCRRRTAGRAGPACRWPSWPAQPLGLRRRLPVLGGGRAAVPRAGLEVTPKAIATRAEWLFELVGAGVGSGPCRPPQRSAARAGQPAGRGHAA